MELIDKIGLIHIQDDRVLMTRSKGKDVFYFPGGKRESGESDEQTLHREIKEELNVELIPGTIMYLNTFQTQAHGQPEGTLLKTTYYSAKYTGELRPSSEIEEFIYCDSEVDPTMLTEMGKLVFAWLKQKDLIE